MAPKFCHITPILVELHWLPVRWPIDYKILYYHLRSTVKRERFFGHVYFSNETVSQTTVSTGPMKMFRLEHETMTAGLTKFETFPRVCTEH